MAHVKRWVVRVHKKTVLFPFLMKSKGDCSVAACYIEKIEVVTYNRQAPINSSLTCLLRLVGFPLLRSLFPGSASFVPDASREVVVTLASALQIIYGANYTPVLSISQTSVVLHSETIAGNRVFQAVCWTNTHNNYLSTEELQNLIDEDPKELRRILRVGDRRKRSEGYTMFLRAHGVLVRTFRGYPHWCLLGVGPIQMTLRQTEHLQHVMSAESKGPYL